MFLSPSFIPIEHTFKNVLRLSHLDFTYINKVH